MTQAFEFEHGVKNRESDKPVLTVVESTAGLPILIGVAPINTATEPAINEAKVAYSKKEAIKYFGYSTNFKDYTISEMIDAAFELYGVAPVAFINVLDPEKHKATGTETVDIVLSKAILKTEGILIDTLKLNPTGDETLLVKGTDYLSTFDDEGHVVITLLNSIPQAPLVAKFDKIDPTKVTEADIIGGADVNTGKTTGIEAVNQVFPKYRLVPGQLLAPGYSENPVVEAVLKTKANNINTYFEGIALADIDTTAANVYNKVLDWKTDNNYTSPEEYICWPQVSYNGKQYRLSTHLACRIALTDNQNGDIPYVSPSNKELKMNKAVLADGTEVYLGPDQAKYLNSIGVVTALNFINGWVAWGNRTAAFPESTYVRETFMAIRRMRKWIGNTLILTHWKRVDDPTDRVQIDGVVDVTNMWLNGLESERALLGAKVAFLNEENSEEDLANGITRYHIYFASPTPNEQIDFILEYDSSFVGSLLD